MEQQIAEILAALQQSAETMAPVAWNALVLSARVDSILTLAYVVFATVVTASLVKAWPKLWERACRHDLEPGLVIVSALVGILQAVAVAMVFSSATWLGLINPEAQAVVNLLKAAQP